MTETSATPLEQPGRAIINSAYDITNVVPIETEAERICKTLDTCITVLEQSCGIRSSYAMQVKHESLGLTFDPDVFTRDGISILKFMEFASPMEKYIKNLLTYIGDRIDFVAKDGTTTSMLTAARVIRHYIQAVIDGQPLTAGKTIYERHEEAADFYHRLTESLKTITLYDDILDESKYTEKEAMEIAGKVAFMQALSASGGNLQLANAMRDIFRQSPRRVWHFFKPERSIRETDTPFSVIIPEYDSRVTCSASLADQYNKILNTEWSGKNVAFYFFADNLEANSWAAEVFFAELDNIPQDQPVAILGLTFAPRMIQKCQQLNLSRAPENKITMWAHPATTQVGTRSWDWKLQVLAAQLGAVPVDCAVSRDLPITPVTVKEARWYSGAMHIYDSIPRDTDTCLHLWALHPELATPYFIEVMEACQEQIDLFKTQHRLDDKGLRYFEKAMNDLLTVRRPTLMLGGTTHEQVANVDVVQDVAGSIMNILTYGFVLGNTPVAVALKKDNADVVDTSLTGVVLQTLREVANRTIKLATLPKPTECIIEDGDTDISPDQYCYCSYNGTSGWASFTDYWNKLDLYFKGETELRNEIRTTYPPLQPASLYSELFKRIDELVWKFVNSSQIIVSGALLVNEDKKDGNRKSE